MCSSNWRRSSWKSSWRSSCWSSNTSIGFDRKRRSSSRGNFHSSCSSLLSSTGHCRLSYNPYLANKYKMQASTTEQPILGSHSIHNIGDWGTPIRFAFLVLYYTNEIIEGHHLLVLQYIQNQEQSMDQNMLGVNPYQPRPIQQISDKICQILDKVQQNDHHIEIEFKYAELIAFSNSYYEREQLPNEVKKKVLEVCARHVLEQNGLHLNTLKKLSNYNLVLLNVLGGRVYKLCGGFDELVHRKFYKIREFLINLCRQNDRNSQNHLNFYREIQSIYSNRTLRMANESELRLDVNIRQGEKAGRYSYLVGQGWTLTRKQNLVKEEFDLMLAERTFRLGIKREIQIPQSFDQIESAISDPESERGGIFLRFKRALRVVKNEEVEIALSQIYQPEQERRNECIEDLKYLLQMQPKTLDEFCGNVFQQFYMWDPKPNELKGFADSVSKFEIESEFTAMGVKRIRELRSKKKYHELDRYLETTLNDLFALYFVDHNIKKREVTVINKILKQEYSGDQNFIECRLQNEFGTYMHDLVYDYMTNQ